MELPEAWPEYDSNYVTWIKNQCVKFELNWIKNLIQIQSKNVSWIKLETVIQIKSEMAS